MSAGSSILVLSSQRGSTPFLWGVISLLLSLWSFGLYLCFSAENAQTSLLWACVVNYIALFLPVLVFHFTALFVGQLQYNSRVLQFYYLVTFIYLIAAIAWPEGFLNAPVYRLDLFWFPMAGPLFYFFPLLVLFVLGHGVQLLVKARSAQGRHSRLKSTYLLVAIIVGVIGAGSTLPLEFGVNIPPYGIFCVAIMNVMFTYAMLKHDLLDIPETISVIIAKLMTYLSIFFLVVIVIHFDLFSQNMSFTQSQLVFLGVLLVLVCELYSVIKVQIQTLSDRMLARRRLQGKSALGKLLESLNCASNYDAMLPLLRDFFENQPFIHHYAWYLEQSLMGELEPPVTKQGGDIYQRILFSAKDRRRHDKLPLTLGIAKYEPEKGYEQKVLSQLMISEQFDTMHAWVEKVPEREVITLPIFSDNTFYGLFLLVVSSTDMHYSDQGIVNELADKFSYMVERIAFHRKQSLSQQTSLLEKMSNMQALAGSIAHEMRTPLTQLDFFASNVMSTVDMKRDQPSSQRVIDETLSSQAELAQRSIERSLQIIDITLNQVRGQKLDVLNFKRMFIQSVVTKALAEYVFLPDERAGVSSNLRQNFDFKGDETQLIYVLFNLFKNSLYYGQGRAGFKISLNSIVNERQNVLVFRDNGPGVSEELQEKIFEEFVSINNSHGTGLGLAYCKRVMRDFGGDIICHSELGEFTEFRLEFPLCYSV
jgi:signal transduction histidine kinase